jgi:hypothetical protein
MRFPAFLFIVLLTVPSILSARPDGKDSSSVDGVIQSLFGNNQPRIGLITSVDAEARYKDDATLSSFNIHVLRLYLRGSVNPHFAYVYQAELNGSAKTLDLKFTWRPLDWLSVDAGQFKPAFGKEFLQTEARIPFVNRSLAAQTISPGRQRGVQANSSFVDGSLDASIGAFSGNGITDASDKRISLYSAKVHIVPGGIHATGDLRSEFSGSIMITNDAEDINTIPLPGKNRMIVNGQMRTGYQAVWLETEYAIAASGGDKTLESVYGDIGWKAADDWEVLGRFDWTASYRTAAGTPLVYTWKPVIMGRKYIAGANWFPLKELKLQLNGEYDQALSTGGAYLNVQYAVNDR